MRCSWLITWAANVESSHHPKPVVEEVDRCWSLQKARSVDVMQPSRKGDAYEHFRC